MELKKKTLYSDEEKEAMSSIYTYVVLSVLNQ